MKYITTINDKEFLVEIIDEHRVSINGQTYHVDFEAVSGQPVYSLIVDGKSHEGFVRESDDEWQVLLRGRLYPAKVEDEREKRLRAAAGGGVASGRHVEFVDYRHRQRHAFELGRPRFSGWRVMNVLIILIPVALFLGGLGLAAFLWALKSGQFEDLDGAAERILIDEPEGDAAA